MLEAVNHPALKIQYDCYHMAMMGEDVLEGLQENIHQIGHIQFADCPDAMNPIRLKSLMSKFFHGLNKARMTVTLQQNINLKTGQISHLHGKRNTFRMM